MTFEIFSSLKSHIIRWPRHLLMAGSLCLLVACGGGGGGGSSAPSAASIAPLIPSLVRTDGGSAVNPGFEAVFTPLFSTGTGKLSADDGSFTNRTVISGELIRVRPQINATYTLVVSYQDPTTVRSSILQATATTLVAVNNLPNIIPTSAQIVLTPDSPSVAPSGNVKLFLNYPAVQYLEVVSTSILIGVDSPIVDNSIVGVIRSNEFVTKTGLTSDTTYRLQVTYRDTRYASLPTYPVLSAPVTVTVQTGPETIGNAEDMKIARSDFSATLIASKGQVLVCGGVTPNGTILSSCEIYDSNLRTWKLLPSAMTKPRRGHAATLLYGGSNVLISGGYEGSPANTASKTTDIYDSASQSFTAGPQLIEARSGHSSVLLSTQKVLIFGGAVSSGNGTVAELVTFDAKGKATIAATGSLNAPRQDHTTTLLPTGEVLVTGRTADASSPAYNTTGNLINDKSFEIYNEVTGLWTLGVIPMKVGRSNHAASLLPYDEATRASIQILLSGGSGIAASTSAEILTRTSTGGTTPTVTWTTSSTSIPMPAPRSFHTSTTLSSGDVLLIGGKGTDVALSDLKTIDTFISLPPGFSTDTQKTLNYARSMHKSIKLPNDTVLIIGNYFKDVGKADTKAELWSPPPP